MKMNKYISAVVLSLLLCGCMKETDGFVETISLSITCATEGRTYFPDHTNGTISWNSNDILWVFDESGKAYKFTGPSSATSSSVFTCTTWPTGARPQYALFNPKYTKGTLSDGLIQAQMPAEQTIAHKNSFSKYSNISVGKVVAENGTYGAQMKNVCGLLKLYLEDDGIQSVRISGNSGENLAGTIRVDHNGGNPSYSFVSGASGSITLIPRFSSTTGGYVKGTYYICMLPQTFEKGITITMTDKEGLVAEVYGTEPLTVERNAIIDLGRFGSSNMDFRKMSIDSPMEIDFSRVGYHYGEDDFPSYDTNIIYLEPEGNGATPEEDEIIDRTEDINKAIRNIGKPGTVVLKAGRYYVAEKIFINTGGVILRGETDPSQTDPLKRNRTTVIGTLRNTTKPSLVVFGNQNSEPVKGSGAAITGARIPEGSMYVTVSSPTEFSVGESIIIYRPDNTLWHHDLGMDSIISKDGAETYSWTDHGHTFDMNIERIITSIDGNRLYLDAPLPMSIEAKYGGGQVFHCSLSHPRVSESGLEDINLDNLFDKSITSTQHGGHSYQIAPYYADENHYWNAIRFFGAEHCWVKGVTGSHFCFSTVSIYGCSKNITVEDCHSYEPVSTIYSPRRYAFTISSGQLCLFRGCTTEKDRHQFVTTGVQAIGPHVFLDCTATESYSNAGPHSHWATCILYDRLKTDELLSVEDASYLGYSSGAQGWQGANHVLWNCEAKSLICQSPQVSARNWAWGCIGVKNWGSLDSTSAEGKRPDGEWHSHGAHLEPSSLYEKQLEDRLSAGNAIMSIIKK